LNTETYTYLLANPQKINQEHLDDLASVIEKYPYFQSARALQLKGLKNENSFLYNDSLKATAAHTSDRDILFEYITSERFIQNEISDVILQHDASVFELDVISDDVSEQISIEIDNQIKSELKKAEAILNPALFERKIEAVEKIVEEEAPEEILKLDSPLPFTKDDTHSFSQWLKLTKATPIDRIPEAFTEKSSPPEEVSQSEKERKFELIDKFILEKTKITPRDTTESRKGGKENTNLAAPFVQASDALMTETLAKVYLQQKNYKKAIQAYKILILKNPEKSGFFADQIRAVKKLINKDES